MSFWVVIRKNETFPIGTKLALTDEGYQKVELESLGGGRWKVGKRIGLIHPPTQVIGQSVMELGSGTLPPDILAKIREDFNK